MAKLGKAAGILLIASILMPIVFVSFMVKETLTVIFYWMFGLMLVNGWGSYPLFIFDIAGLVVAIILLVIGIGTATFLAYYLLSPILFGDTTDYWRMNPTPFVLWFLWIEILFAYVWRKWPIYRAV